MIKKYPIDTKVRYTGNCKQCRGTTGKIISVHKSYCRVNLLDSSHCEAFGWVAVDWKDLEPIGQQQLEFAFMRTNS